MNILIVGSSSGLGKEILEQKIKNGNNIYAISKYTNESIYNTHYEHTKSIIKADLSKIDKQQEINFLLKDMPDFEQIYFAIGGGFGRKDILPSYEDILYVYKLNVFLIFSMIKAFYENNQIGIKSKICTISSIASQEVTASPSYSSAKSALNTLGKTMTKQNKNYFGSLTNFLCGAFEGNGTGFDRLKVKNHDAYNLFISNRLPNGRPIQTSELASYIIKTMDFSTDLLDGLTIKVDGNESVSI